MKEEMSGIGSTLIALIILTLVLLIPMQLKAQESDVSMKALCVYNDDDLMTVSDVRYCEESYRVIRGFPDFWNIKTIYSYVTAEYPNGMIKHYVVETDVETGEYKIC